ncbi:hypothetical protein A0256_22760 [Mucilaginibacter sp. PAMC 26640]|nr:hypothetical protein A0256_22760 [Mucilaginibacter sp. PAMC 26640]
MSTKNKQRKLSLFDKIVLGLNIIAALFLLLSYLSPSVDPRDSVFISLLGFLYIYLVLGNILFILYWPFRKPVFAIISALAILLGFGTFFKYVSFNGTEAKSSKNAPSEIRILQYNVRKFEGIDRFLNMPIQNEIVKVIDDNQPDIVTMVEFRKAKINHDSVSTSLRNVSKLGYNYFKSFYLDKQDSTGNVVFSKYPILAAGSVDTSSMLNTKAIYADILYKTRKIRIYSLHLAAVTMNDKKKKRVLGGQVGFAQAFYLKDRVSAAFIARSYQVDRIKRHIESCQYPYIITGDFNDTPNSYAVNELGEGLNNAFVEKGSGFQTTYFSSFPLQIDYILTTKDFDIVNYNVLNKKISDHKPVISDVRLN